jgi:hypothetical protein
MNDDRPIEKLLRRYAKKRRADAGPPVGLHPATRRLLQGEVARQFRNATPSITPPSFKQIWKSWLPRLAWAVPLLVLIGAGLWSLLDWPGPKQLALGPATIQRTAADGSRASKAERREPESLPSTLEVQSSTAVETAPAGFSAAKASPPSPAAAPIRSLNQPAPGLADQGIAGKNHDVAQALAFGAVPNQPIVSLAGTAEQKGDQARGGSKEITRADKLGIVSSAAPARTRFAEASSANRVNTLPADSTTETAAARQPDRGKTGVYAAKVSGIVTPLVDAPGTSASLERDQAQTFSQSFVNLAPETLKQKTAKAIAPRPISPVLANFRLEQTGRQLRVVDSDGSTYVGETDASPAFWAGPVAASAEQGSRSGVYAAGAGSQKIEAVQLFKSDGKLNQLPAAAKSVAESQMQNTLYRVAGTNRTLNQTVEFTWSFVAMTNEPIVAQAEKIGVDLNKDGKKLPNQLPGQLQNSFITGRAQFGTGKEIEINAVPVSP